MEGENIDDLFYHESFSGYDWWNYYKNYYYVNIDNDPANFFDGEFPELRFDKMTKEAFLEQYGDVENISELLEEITDVAVE